jgi:protein-disulfide isomerase
VAPLPLTEVHEHALIAAEASESAAAQGRFWEMHDLLFRHQDALELDDLVDYARELRLDVDRFSGDLRSRRHALCVERDVQSADQSGVTGTPTFFVNGRRHVGYLPHPNSSSRRDQVLVGQPLVRVPSWRASPLIRVVGCRDRTPAR